MVHTLKLNMASFWFKLFFIAISLTAVAVTAEVQDQKLLILLLDSLRHDFLKSPKLDNFPNLKRLVQEGSMADRNIPVIPSLTYPNFYSLLTGVNTEQHSFTHNTLYDSTTGKKFVGNFQGDDLDPQWYTQDTILTTAAKQGKKVYGYNLPMCTSPPATFCDPNLDLTSLSKFGELVHNATEALRGDADLAGVYVGQPDLTMHVRGVDDPSVIATVQVIDDVIGRVLKSVRDNAELSKLNIIIVSDHGQITLLKDKFSYWGSAIDREDLDELIYNAGTAIQLWPKEGKETTVIAKLKASNAPINVYRRHEIPEDWHMKRGKWVPPVYVTSDYGHIFLENDSAIAVGSGLQMGFHGFHVDNPDVSGACLAWGPAFKKGYSHPAIKSTDAYQLFTTVLNITPHPHNGSWERVKDMLACSSADQTLRASFALCLAIAVKILIF